MFNLFPITEAPLWKKPCWRILISPPCGRSHPGLEDAHFFTLWKKPSWPGGCSFLHPAEEAILEDLLHPVEEAILEDDHFPTLCSYWQVCGSYLSLGILEIPQGFRTI